jgi:hypothetical protein
MGLIRVNKLTNEIDSSIIIPQLEGFEDLELKPNFEWIDLNSEWYQQYEMKELGLVEKRIKHFSDLSFEKRALEIPEYKLVNASLGVYDAVETERIRLIVERYRNEFYRLQALCLQAKTAEELELIQWEMQWQ